MSKMSANKENNLVQAYVELNKFCQSGDYDRALKSAGKILQIAPGEQKAFHCKVVCFIHLHNFKEALTVLCNPKNAALAADLHFEKAYTQYRLNSPKDALATVDAAPELTPALKELRSQILYRLEQYQDCYNLYRDLVKNTDDEYEEERKANMAAVIANLAAVNPTSDLPQFEEQTYELAYNAGSTLALRGRYADALATLRRAEQASAESVIEDGGTEDDVREEAAIIRVQQAYCLQQMGKEKEAAAIYQKVLKDKPSDQALVAIASNNLVVINRDTNVFDSRKRMKAASQDGLEHKLNSRQRAAITYNQAILAIYSNQPDFCKQCCVKLVREFGQESRAALVEASSLLKENKRSQAVTLLLKQGGTLPLAAAQVLLLQGDRKGAIKLLEESEFKYRPAVIAVLCTLLCADNEFEKASQMFTDVYEHYKNDESSVALLRPMWRTAAAVHARCGRAAAAAAAHEAQARAAPSDPRSLARLVKALAAADPARARRLAAGLPPLAQLEGKIDIEALESSKWMMGAKVVKKTVTKQEQSPGTPGSELINKKSQKKRKRRTKLPPTADLSRAPDPERWLPKYERTAYRKRRGVRRDVIKGSQGMSTTATDQYDMSKVQATAAASTTSAKSPRVETKSNESGWQRKQQQKKKNKRR